MQSLAFAPGHISGFFQPCYHKDPLQTGSRGAGFSVNLGVQTQITLESSKEQSIKIHVNDHLELFPVVHKCIYNLIQHKPYSISVDISSMLPFSQGFGMSAACALSTALGLSHLLHLPAHKAIEAAHTAEVQQHTGLGDVIGSSIGGMEIRKIPGLPPYGSIQCVPGKFEVLLCVIDTPLRTEDILQNTELCEVISAIGNRCTNQLLMNPTVESFFSLSKTFAIETGLATQKMIKIIKEIEPITPCSMCMLGNALFTIYNPQVEVILQKYGTIYHTSVDTYGARIL